MNIAEAVTADRARRNEGGKRKQLSRRKYAELVGLSEQRVWAIEQGKRLKAGELDALKPHLGDLIEDSGGHLPQTVSMSPDQERDALRAAVAFLRTRLAGKPVPPHLGQSINLDTAQPGEFARVRAWVQAVHEYLDGVRPEEEIPDVVGFDYESEPFPEDEIEDAPVEVEAVKEPEPEPEPEFDPIEKLKAYREPEPEPEPEVIAVEPAPDLELDEQLRYVTNSELRCFKRCRRKWYLDYVRGVKPKREDVVGAASVGTRVHAVLASYYVPRGEARPDPWDVFQATIEDDEKILAETGADEKLRKRWSSEVDLARAMVEGYLDWVEETAADAGLEITAPETKLVANPKFPELDHVRLLAKLDVRATRNLDGARLFLDHKTVQDLVTPQKVLHLDEQMLHYHLIEYLDLLESGNAATRTDGAIYNMLRKVKRSATANPPFYGRVEVRHNLDELRNYWLRVLQTVRDMEAVRRALDEGQDHRQVAYPTPTRDCTWQCPHLAICGMFDDGSHAEQYIEDLYVETSPLKRYEP